MNKKRFSVLKFAAMILLAVIMVMPAFVEPAEAANARIYRLARDRVRLRTAPTSSYDNIITTLKKGTRMVKIGAQGNWFRVVTASGRTGWIFSKPYLAYYGAAAQKKMAITTMKTPLLAKAKLSATKKETLAVGTPLIVKRYNSVWAQVQTLNGKSGYVRTPAIKHLF